MPIAVLTFGFDPIAHPFGDLAVRWGVIALAGVLIASLVAAGLLARGAGLRADDLAFIAIGAVPGAVVGGRLGYALLHWDYFASHGQAIVDPAVGSLELGLGVLGGLLTAGYVARLLGAPVGRWLHVADVPAPVRHRGRQAQHGPDRLRPGRAERRSVGDRLRGTRPMGIARRRRCRRNPRRRMRGSRP